MGNENLNNRENNTNGEYLNIFNNMQQPVNNTPEQINNFGNIQANTSQNIESNVSQNIAKEPINNVNDLFNSLSNNVNKQSNEANLHQSNVGQTNNQWANNNTLNVQPNNFNNMQQPMNNMAGYSNDSNNLTGIMNDNIAEPQNGADNLMNSNFNTGLNNVNSVMSQMNKAEQSNNFGNTNTNMPQNIESNVSQPIAKEPINNVNDLFNSLSNNVNKQSNEANLHQSNVEQTNNQWTNNNTLNVQPNNFNNMQQPMNNMVGYSNDSNNLTGIMNDNIVEPQNSADNLMKPMNGNADTVSNNININQANAMYDNNLQVSNAQPNQNFNPQYNQNFVPNNNSSAFGNNNNQSINNNPGGRRKKIKADSKSQIKGFLIGTTAIMYIFMIVGVLITSLLSVSLVDALKSNSSGFMTTAVCLAIVFVITIIIGQIFTFAITSGALDAARGKKSSFKNVLSKSFSNLKAIFLLLIIFYGFFLVNSIIMIIPILSIVSLVLEIYMYPVYVVLLSMYADDNYPKKSLTGMIKDALRIVKGHRVEYYGTIASFIGWIILNVLTFGLLFVWVHPYIRLAEVNMYRRWIGEANYDSSESGLSNGAVIGLCFSGYVVLVLVLSVFISVLVENNLNRLYNTNDSYDENYSNDDKIQKKEDSEYNNYDSDYNAEDNNIETTVDDEINSSEDEIKNVFGINMYIPSDFKSFESSSSANFSIDGIEVNIKEFVSSTGLDSITVMKMASSEKFDMNDYAQKYKESFSNSLECNCGSVFTKMINGSFYYTFVCDYLGNMNTYIVEKNGNIYAMSVVTRSQDLIKKFEKNLSVNNI